ncbi:hypothetical protein SAMN04487846_1681 [Microbacterium sp. cf046]|uniref:hypothetical protein n=1 Tax=Microbacterium sp. cf046 TaxID=1761803 RepID=UPI0008DFCBC0|nr:hypothetical protein [Microbacterium sp. cf046]SFS03533.1 hypothetical protein SAMN04487846_1681 [Microbacterium sp. cf046]
MISRLAATALALALVIGVATGCRPEPSPSPSAPAFANEDEAFAAAEETYRAYVDALNQRRSDPTSQPDPQEFLTGQALEVDIATQQQLDQAGLSVVGSTDVTSISPKSADPELGDVRLEVCLDSTGTRVLDESGHDVTAADRQPVSLLTVDFVFAAPDLLVESSTTKIVGGC